MNSIRYKQNLYLYLFGSNTSVFGDVMLTTAMALHIMKLTQSPKMFGGILATAFIPRLILSLFSGAIVDRLDQKKIMITLDLVRGFVLIGFLFFGHLGLTAIVPLIIGFAMADTFFVPASISIVPRLFDKENIGTVNSLDQSIRSTLNVISPMIASLLLTWGGLRLIIFIDAFTFILSAFSEMFFDADTTSETKAKYQLIQDMKTGVKVIFSDVRVASLIANGALSHLFLFSFIEVGMISLLVVTFKAPEFHYGILQGAISASAILASFIALHQKDKRKIAGHINIGIIGMIGAVLLFAPLGSKHFITWISKYLYFPVTYLSIACFCMFLSFGYYVVFFRTFYQSEVPKEYLGRFSSIFVMFIALSRISGMYIYGILFEKQRIIYPVLILAFGMIVKLIVHIPFLKAEGMYKQDENPL